MSTISKTKMVVSFDLAATFSYLSKIAHLLHIAFSSPFLAIKNYLDGFGLYRPLLSKDYYQKMVVTPTTRGVVPGGWQPQILADQLTLSQPGARGGGQIMPTK